MTENLTPAKTSPPRLIDDELDLLAELVPLAGRRLIELGCGNARLARTLLARHPDIELTGLEVDQRQHAKNLAAPQPRLHFVAAGAQAIPFDDASFDGALMLKSLHHVPMPLMDTALDEMARVLRPGGWACSMVFSGPERNPCLTTLMGTALRHAGLPPRDPYQPGGLLSLGRPGHVDTLFREAGLRDVATTTLDAPFELRSVDEYVDFVKDSAGPVRELLAALDASAAQAAWTDITTRLRSFEDDHGWHGPNELLLTAARR